MNAFTDLTDIMERAARNGTRAHLPVEVVRAAIQHPAYVQFQAERLKELAATWEEKQPPIQAGCSSEPTGSGIASIATTGASAGTMTEEQADSVGRAASARASEAVRMVGRRGRRKTP